MENLLVSKLQWVYENRERIYREQFSKNKAEATLLHDCCKTIIDGLSSKKDNSIYRNKEAIIERYSDSKTIEEFYESLYNDFYRILKDNETINKGISNLIQSVDNLRLQDPQEILVATLVLRLLILKQTQGGTY